MLYFPYLHLMIPHYGLLAFSQPFFCPPDTAWTSVQPQMQLSDFTFTFHFYALEKEMATHSSVLAWRIPGTGEPGGLPSTGSHGVGHD